MYFGVNHFPVYTVFTEICCKPNFAITLTHLFSFICETYNLHFVLVVYYVN